MGIDGIFSSINISATGLSAERIRMNVLSNNIANAYTSRSETGTPYRRQEVVFKSLLGENSEISMGGSDFSGQGVKVEEIVEDMSPYKQVFKPEHPDADEDGYVLMPNINVLEEMTDMIAASRAYEANIAAINASKSMLNKALDIIS